MISTATLPSSCQAMSLIFFTFQPRFCGQGWAASFHGYVLHETAGGRAMVKHQFVIGILVMMTALHGCGGGARPYGAMHKAAESELTASAQARDHRLKMELRTT